MTAAEHDARGFLSEALCGPDPAEYLQLSHESAETAAEWLRGQLWQLGARPLEPHAEATVWNWLEHGGERATVALLQQGRPVALVVESDGEMRVWRVWPVEALTALEEPVLLDPQALAADRPSARVPVERRNMFPPGPPGGIAVRYESQVTELSGDTAPIIEEVTVDRPVEALSWMRIRLRQLVDLMDAEEQARAALWLGDSDLHFDIVTWLSQGTSYVTGGWTMGSVRVRMIAGPAQKVDLGPVPGRGSVPR